MASSAGNLRWGVTGMVELAASVVKRRTGKGEIAFGVFGAALALSAALLVATGQTYVGWPAAVAIAVALIVGAAAIWKVREGRRRSGSTAPCASCSPTPVEIDRYDSMI